MNKLRTYQAGDVSVRSNSVNYEMRSRLNTRLCHTFICYFDILQ